MPPSRPGGRWSPSRGRRAWRLTQSASRLSTQARAERWRAGGPGSVPSHRSRTVNTPPCEQCHNPAACSATALPSGCPTGANAGPVGAPSAAVAAARA
eukprot:1031080-Prymnesium_polylepis.1